MATGLPCLTLALAGAFLIQFFAGHAVRGITYTPFTNDIIAFCKSIESWQLLIVAIGFVLDLVVMSVKEGLKRKLARAMKRARDAEASASQSKSDE